MKRALSVGINYPGTAHELRGCVNDSYAVEKLLRTKYGFTDITLLLDNDATTANIRRALENLTEGAKPGDTLFFHYSGHGSQVPNQRGDDDNEPDGLDEIICPVDLDWNTKMIRDDELKDIFDAVPNGVNLTVFLDCCNSGGGMDHLNQYQSLAPGAREVSNDDDSRNRFLTPPQHLTEQAETLGLQVKPRALTRQIDQSGLLISGCQSQQTSADAYIDGMYQGAATYYLCNTLRVLGYDASYLDLIDRMNKDIAADGFTQRPELNGPTKLFNQKFLSDISPLFDGSEPTAPVTPVVKPEDNKDDDKKNDTIKIVLLIAIIAAAVFAGASGLT